MNDRNILFLLFFHRPYIFFQKGILKQNGSVSKRRRVVFAPVDNVDDGASSDSFSGLEVEVMCRSLSRHYSPSSSSSFRHIMSDLWPPSLH